MRVFAVYNEQEIEQLNNFIKHERDENISYVGMEQFRGKYLAQNRATGRIYETPQIAYMMISATLFSAYPTETRIKYVKDFYDAISNFDISLPTPIMAGLRTPQRQFSSCVLIETDDSLDSINSTVSSIVKYVSQKQVLVLALVLFVPLAVLLDVAMQHTLVLFRFINIFNQQLSLVVKAVYVAEQQHCIIRYGI